MQRKELAASTRFLGSSFMNRGVAQPLLVWAGKRPGAAAGAVESARRKVHVAILGLVALLGRCGGAVAWQEASCLEVAVDEAVCALGPGPAP